MNSLVQLNQMGQSIWFDNIERAMLAKEGVLARMIAEDDLRGVTSNPAIFEKAITRSSDYDAQIYAVCNQQPNISARALFFELAIDDIRAACDLMDEVYQRTQGQDGLVSLEVSPDLANDTAATITEALELWRRLDRKNAMIKIPATQAGIPAIRHLIAEGININVTLLFSVERYMAAAHAYIDGLCDRAAKGLPVSGIASVASFFVSRVDAALSDTLANKAPELLGQIAIANAKKAYQAYQQLFKSDRFTQLLGAQTQRLLWASTATKDPALKDTLYVEALIGAQTVNTVPPATYAAFKDHGVVGQTLESNVSKALAMLSQLSEIGIDLNTVTDQLEREGVAAFDSAFKDLLAAISSKIQ